MLKLSRVLLLGYLSSLLGAGHPESHPGDGDTSALEFLGFRAGARISELNAELRRAGGRGLRCRGSRVDQRVTECRALLRKPDQGATVEIWISAIDSTAGVITLSGRMSPSQLELWRSTLQDRYGTVQPRVQGSQSMLQWVRRGRMLRLTWRLEGTGKVASVSLVDGRVLDNWARARQSSQAAPPIAAGAGALSP
jgi:hypothetical protein